MSMFIIRHVRFARRKNTRWSIRARVTFSQELEPTPKPFASIPFSRDPDFVIRSNILDQIGQQCSQPAGRVALVGLGGVGKTQLAIELAHRMAKNKDLWVFWVHAGSLERIQEDFRKIADIVKLEDRHEPTRDIMLLVSSWLANPHNGRWLVVLDNADKRELLFDTVRLALQPRQWQNIYLRVRTAPF